MGWSPKGNKESDTTERLEHACTQEVGSHSEQRGGPGRGLTSAALVHRHRSPPPCLPDLISALGGNHVTSILSVAGAKALAPWGGG